MWLWKRSCPELTSRVGATGVVLSEAKIRLSRNSRGWPRGVMRSGMTEELGALQVECEPLEESADVEEPVAAPCKHLYAVVEALDNAAGLPTPEVIRDRIQPPLDRSQKALELDQPTLAHPLAPHPDRALGPRLRVVTVEQGGQVFPQVVGGLDLRRVGEEALEQVPLLRFELPRPLAKGPHRPCDLGIRGLGQGSLEPLEFLFTDRVGAVAVGPRHGEPIDDDLGPRDFLWDRVHEALIHIGAGALDRAPQWLGDRAQEGCDRLLLAVCQPCQDLDASPLARHRHPRDNIAVPALERDLVEAEHTQPLPGVPLNGALDPAVEEALDGLLRDPQLARGVCDRGVDQHPQGPWLRRFRVGAARLVPCTPWRRRGAPRTVGAAIACGPDLDQDGHVEQRQMAQAYDCLQSMPSANLPSAATTLGAVQGALNAEEPMPLLGPVRREDADVGQVQRHLNKVVHRTSHSAPVPRSSHTNRFLTLPYLGAHHGNSGRAWPSGNILPLLFGLRLLGFGPWTAATAAL